MASNTETATSKVILDGQQAEDELKQLKKLAQETRQEYEKMKLAKDPEATKKLKEWETLDKQVKKSSQSFFDLNTVIKNLNGTSLKDLQKAQRELNALIRKQARDTDEDKAALKVLQDQYVKVGNEIDSVRGSMRKMDDATSQSGMSFKSVIGSVMSFAASLGIAVGALEIVKGLISSTDVISDKFNETVGGLRSGLSYFARSLSTLDFSNFLTNMNAAIKAGVDYVKTLDQIEDRTRSISILESKDRERIADLQIISRTVTNTKEARIAAAKEILDIENKNAERRKSIANDQLQNELSNASAMSGLSKKRIEELLIEQETNREMVAKAKEYNDALSEFRASQANQSGGSMYGLSPAPVDKKTLDILRQTPEAVKKYAEELNKFGKLNEQEYDKITQAFQKTGEENASFAETTARTQIRLSKLNQGILDESESTVKEYNDTIIEAKKSLAEQITEMDNAISTAIENGDIPLAQKLTAEKKAAQDLLDVYIELKKQIEKGWDVDQRDMGPIEAIVSKTATNVVSGKTGKSPLQARSNDIQSGPTDQTQDQEQLDQDWKDARIDAALAVNTTLSNIVMNRQQAELDHKLNMLDKQREAELANENLTQQQKDAINSRYDAKARKAKQEAWKKQRNADAISTTIATILAVMKAGGPLNPVGALTALAGALSVVEIMSQKVPEFSKGRYNVTGASTGKQYDNVSYTGPAVTGLYTRPALVAENGGEMIIDSPTTKNLMMNFPGIIDAINMARIPQFASGRYTSAQAASGPVSTSTDPLLLAVIKENTEMMRSIKENGVQSIISLFDLEKKQAQKANIQSATEM